MRAAVFHETGRPLAIETVADPRPAPGRVIVDVGGTGICGSDLHVTSCRRACHPGLILGHKYARTIAPQSDRTCAASPRTLL